MKIRGSSTSDLCFWRCEQHRQGCEARATLEGSSVVVRKEHNHPPNPAGITTQEAIANTRKRAREENTPINTIYDDQLVEISMEDHADDALSQLPSLESLRSTLYRARHETIPHLPTFKKRRRVSRQVYKNSQWKRVSFCQWWRWRQNSDFHDWREPQVDVRGTGVLYGRDFFNLPSCICSGDKLLTYFTTNNYYYFFAGLYCSHHSLWAHFSNGLLSPAWKTEADIQPHFLAPQRCCIGPWLYPRSFCHY